MLPFIILFAKLENQLAILFRFCNARSIVPEAIFLQICQHHTLNYHFWSRVTCAMDAPWLAQRNLFWDWKQIEGTFSCTDDDGLSTVHRRWKHYDALIFLLRLKTAVVPNSEILFSHVSWMLAKSLHALHCRCASPCGCAPPCGKHKLY